MVPYKLLE